MSATHTVSHLHLRHVKVLGTSAQTLTRHTVLKVSRVGHIRGWKPERHLRTCRLLLVCRPGLDLLLPFHELFQFGIIVRTEIAANGFHNVGQLTLVTPTFCHEIGHHATKFLPTEVGILKFCTAYMCAKYRKKHRNKGFLHVF